METGNKNIANDKQQAEAKRKQEMLAIYNKMIAFADNITDDYNDDPDIEASHVLLSFGVFMHRLEKAMEDDNATLKNGESYKKQKMVPDAFSDMTKHIRAGYELAKSLDTKQPE